METNETIQIQPNTWTLVELGAGFTILEVYFNNGNMRYSFSATAENGIPAESIISDRDTYVKVISTDAKAVDLIIERR